MVIDEGKKEYISIARKYGIRLDTLKIDAFVLFERGYSPSEVIYILRHQEILPRIKTFKQTIRRYYFDWKQAQNVKRSARLHGRS